MRTSFAELYGIDHPVVQAALGVVSMPALVAAVSEAGGMGTLGAVGTPLMSPDVLRRLIGAVRSLTARPFGVNFMPQFATAEHIAVCIQSRVPVVSFEIGEPPQSAIEQLRMAGIQVWMKAGSVAAAKRAVRAGVDAVIVQGSEAGGSNGSEATAMTLVPAVVDAISPVPVIAAGGIADGRGLVAALALGAEAAWIGTRFVASREANAHEEYKRRIIDAGVGDTRMTSVFCGEAVLSGPVRALRNRVVADCGPKEADPGANGSRIIGRTELGGTVVAMREFSPMLPTPETTGDFDAMCMLAGECAGLVREILPAGTIVRDIVDQAKRIMATRSNGFDTHFTEQAGSR